MNQITYHVKLTLQAKEQLREIVLYISTKLQNKSAALNLVDMVNDTVETLVVNPQRVALTEEEPWHTMGIHKVVIKNYLLYFVPKLQ